MIELFRNADRFVPYTRLGEGERGDGALIQLMSQADRDEAQLLSGGRLDCVVVVEGLPMEINNNDLFCMFFRFGAEESYSRVRQVLLRLLYSSVFIIFQLSFAYEIGKGVRAMILVGGCSEAKRAVAELNMSWYGGRMIRVSTANNMCAN